MDPTDNPYEILGVSESATAREIRTAYRRLALEHHPDRNPNRDNNDTNHKLFAKINHAYEVLTNPDHHYQSKSSSSSTNRHRDPHYYPPQQRFDPFAVFDSVFFQDEFFDRGFFRGGIGDFPAPFWRDQQDNHYHSRVRREDRPPMWFDDPFFKRRNSLFRGGNDFFGPFGGGMDDWFQSTLEDAKNNHHRHGMSSPSTKTSFYSSSTLSRRNSKGQWVTESTVNENGNVTTERITRDEKGNILQRETIEQGPSSTKTKHLPPPPPTCVDTPDHNGGGDKKRLPAPADTTTTAGPKKFRLPWRRGDE